MKACCEHPLIVIQASGTTQSMSSAQVQTYGMYVEWRCLSCGARGTT